jgi:hypothetical protein
METKYNFTTDDGSEDIVYLDIFMFNNTEKKLPATVNISRSKSILEDNCDQYLFSIIRMKVPVITPLFIFPSFPLTIRIENNGVAHSASLIFQPTTNDTDNIGGVYSYQMFANMVNDCINRIYDAFTPKPSINPPMMLYDEVTSLYSMYYPLEYIDDVYPYTANVPKIYFNNDLYLYWNNWINIEDVNVGYRRLLCLSKGINKVPYPTNNEYSSIRMTQEYNSSWLTNSLSTLAVTTSTIPVVSVNTVSTDLNTTSRSSNLSYNIIEDFDLSSFKAGDQNGQLVYIPSGGYRYSNLLSKNTLLDLDLSFYLYYGEIKQYKILQIPSKFSMNIRVMFKKKRLNY